MCKRSISARLPFLPLLSFFPVFFLSFSDYFPSVSFLWVLFLSFFLSLFSFPFLSFQSDLLCFPFRSSPFLFFSLLSYFSSINLLFICFDFLALFLFFVLFVTLYWPCLVLSFIYVLFSSFHVFHCFPCHFHLFAWFYSSFLCVIYIQTYFTLPLTFSCFGRFTFFVSQLKYVIHIL